MLGFFISGYSQEQYPNPDLVYSKTKELKNSRVIDRCGYTKEKDVNVFGKFAPRN
jgi:hypothetical protein